jgi:RNA polymerase sigma-70 factor (sigma-E family)
VAKRAGYDEFVAARSARLLRVAYLLTRDWNAAEDLLQTALMKAWFAWSRLDDAPEAYVRKIIATTYVSWRRRRWISETAQATLPDLPADDGIGAIDDRHRLWAALGRLPARQRAVLVLRFYEDLTEAQAAAALGVSVGTVKSQASRALRRLRADVAFDATRDGGAPTCSGSAGSSGSAASPASAESPASPVEGK